MSSKCQGVNNFTPFKKFEYILKNKLEPFSKKIESLIEIWKSLGQCNEQNSDVGYIIQIMDWAKLHTLNIVLTAKWKMFKADFEAKLLSEVEKTQNELMKISDVFSKKFQKLADVIKNPWDDPVLANLLHDSNAAIGQNEIEFFCVETAYLVSVRLKKLCESQCEDLALNLVTAFMNCYNLSQTQNFSLNATKTHILFCFDIHVALLYRYNRKSEIVALFKKLSLEEGLHLIRRFAKKRVKISKVWRNYPEITFLASQVFVTAAVTKPIEENGTILKELLEAWIAFSVEHSMVDKVEVSVRRIIQAATAAQHIYICCEIIHDKFGLKLRTFTIELYIRALTTDMNNLESQKTENDSEKVEETTKRLANGFYNLADILKDNIQVSRECALTAFSLEPTLERLEKIEDLARLSGFNVLDTGQIWECKLHPPVTSSDEICWICNSCGKWMCKPNLDLRLTTNFALNEALNFETLGISSQLCDDLAVVLNGPRYHLLSWLLRWEDLHRLCEMYLNDMERTKNLVTELKFVDIDYSMFATVKREPVDELSGIERGYESFLYADEKLVNMIENCNPEPPELPQAKSDPNTLKTLRMFRHNIKRNKPQVSPTVLESNTLANSSQNFNRENWFSEQHFEAGFYFNQQKLPDYAHQHNGTFNQRSGRSFSDVFFNHLNSSTNSQLTRSSDGAVDFSNNSNRNKHLKEALDFRSGLNKRKTSDNNEKHFDYDNYQNFMNASGDNFLHNMITYEFARVSSEMKKSKPSEFSTRIDATSQQRQNYIKQISTQSSSLMKDGNFGNETLNFVKNVMESVIIDKIPPPRQSSLKPSDHLSFVRFLQRNSKVPSQSESLNLVKNEKVTPQTQSLQETRNDMVPPLNTNLTRSDKLLPHNTKKDVTVPQSLLNFDQIPSHSKSLVKSDSVIPNISYKEFRNKEEEILSPSKGFPSFDKIPPPPSQSHSDSKPATKTYPPSSQHDSRPRSSSATKITSSQNSTVKQMSGVQRKPLNFSSTKSNLTVKQLIEEKSKFQNSSSTTITSSVQITFDVKSKSQNTNSTSRVISTMKQMIEEKNRCQSSASLKSSALVKQMIEEKSKSQNCTSAKNSSLKQPIEDKAKFHNSTSTKDNSSQNSILTQMVEEKSKPLKSRSSQTLKQMIEARSKPQNFSSTKSNYSGKQKQNSGFSKNNPLENIISKQMCESQNKTPDQKPTVSSSNNNEFNRETFSTLPKCTTIKPIPKNENNFLNDSSGSGSKKRSNQDTELVPEKKMKIDETPETCLAKNGIPPSLERELSKNKIIKALLTKNDKIEDKAEISVQNENSSKNANCCLPASNNTEDATNNSCKKINVINCKTPIVQSTQSISTTNNNNHKSVALMKTHCCKSQQEDKSLPLVKDSTGKADKIEKQESLKKDYKVNQSKSLLLKSLSEQHIPIIVEKTDKDSVNEAKIDIIKEVVVKIEDCKERILKEEFRKLNKEFCGKNNKNMVGNVTKNNTNSDEKLSETKKSVDKDLFTYEDKSKPNSQKELKIILHRLSDEVIKSFIPSQSDPSSQNCNCGFNNINKKRPIGRPRKLMCCKYRMSSNMKNSTSSSTTRVFERIDYDKYSLRTLRKHNIDRLKKISSKTPRRNSDIEKKTGPNKNLKKINNNNKEKKILDDSDKMKKPKKDFSDKDKKLFSSSKGDIDKQKNEMNPRVVLERLPLEDSNYVRSVLSNVPGLNDYEMIRPTNVNHIVNVVQISGGRSTSSVPVQNTQTSTQITPHIQRIGQPRSDKPEHNSNSEIPATTTPASTSGTVKPTTSQPSTLINILSQQIIRPGQSNCVRNRSSPLINILSQQIIRPATTQINKTSANSTQPEAQTNTPKVTSTVEQPSQDEVTKSASTTTKSTTNTPSSGQGTILQFICKSTLPKFQQAFGKSVYQNNTETTEAASTCTETVTNADVNKKTQTKNSSVNIQPIQGGVIYTRQMPVGQTINLIPPGRGQVFRIATSNSDQISLVKDTVIHSKMSALLAAALQGKQKTSETQSDGEGTNEEGGTRVTVTRPTLVQNARIVKPVLQIPSNVIRTSPQSNLSSTTLEQLREFDMVYKQIKERSSTNTPSEANTSESNETSQRISVTYLNQGQKYTQLSPVVVVSSYCNLQPAASPALSVTSQGSSSPCVTPAPAPAVPKVSSKSSKGKTVKNTTTQASKASPIPKPQQKPQEDEHTTQRIFDILAEYAEQLRNSPDLNNKPAPRRRSNPPTNPNQSSKRKKNSSSKKSGQCSSMVSEVDIEDHRTVGSEDSSCGVVQISVQEEEQSHIQAVTTESNDSTSGTRQQLILTDAGNNQTRNLIIADSSVGEALKMPNTAVLVPGNYIMPVSMVKGGQQIAVVSGGSKILATVPARSGPNMLLFQSFLNQNRNKSGVPTVKYSAIQPISGISSQSLAGVSGQPPVILPPNSHNLTAVTLGQPLTLKKVDEPDRVNTELLLTISQPRDNGSTSTESTTHPDSTNTITSTVSNIELEETIIHADNSSEKVFHAYQKSIGATPIATPVIAQTSCVKEVIASDEQSTTQNSMTLITSENNKSEQGKTLERVQSVLVTACTSNGPMLSHTPPRYRKPSDSAGTNNEPSNKEEFLHNGEKQNNNEQKQFQGNATYFQNKNKNKNGNPPRVDREMHQLCMQRKQAALERELRLQKSLSEECEDLGVDEPSTSDLFPEADILFDANHSPSFDQSSQDLVKRPPQEIKEENKSGMTLFSDDDNSSSLRTDFLFESVEYQPTGAELEYDQNQQLTNGQSSASNESGSSCEDHTLLQNCASMSDVTLNSPVSPDPYHENIPPSLNKYKFKYSNRRKGERHKPAAETWTVEVSSSEDTTGSTELGKSSSHSPESCTNKHGHSVSCDEELSDGGYKVVRVAISKSDLLKDEESCEELHCEDDLDCSPSGRGARRSVKKMCSCCNGSQDGGASRKRPASRPHTPAPHKKAFLNKKR